MAGACGRWIENGAQFVSIQCRLGRERFFWPPMGPARLDFWAVWPRRYKYTPCVLLPSTVMTLPQI